MTSPRRRRGEPFDHEPEAVIYARKQAGLQQKELARLAGISDQLMCDIEAGRRNATPPTIIKLAAALNCPRVVLERKRPEADDAVATQSDESLAAQAPDVGVQLRNDERAVPDDVQELRSPPLERSA